MGCLFAVERCRIAVLIAGSTLLVEIHLEEKFVLASFQGLCSPSHDSRQ